MHCCYSLYKDITPVSVNSIGWREHVNLCCADHGSGGYGDRVILFFVIIIIFSFLCMGVLMVARLY